MSKGFIDICKEWLDTFVVAISVAMAFRAYFYEPFNIPTGSMMPTLYGNHSVAAKPSDATFWDKGPLKVLKWAWTGDWFKVVQAPATGSLVMQPTNDGCIRLSVSTMPDKGYDVPTDAFGRAANGAPYLPNGLTHGSQVRVGQLIWCGTVKSGDFLFVNRWIWNFRHPKRGDVMIFATTGLDGVQQGTHYIKRMTGLPGEELTMDPPRLVVNGKPVPEEGRIGQISRQEKFTETAAFPYAGFNFSGSEDPRFNVPGRTLAKPGDVAKLGPDEYYACGDNSPASFDSRFWGPVPGKLLRGRAGGVFWPFGSPRWGVIK